MTNRNFRDEAATNEAPKAKRTTRQRSTRAAAKTDKAPSQSKTKFRAIFRATVTPDTIELKQTVKGQPCATLKGALVKSEKRLQHTATVMIFGKVVNDLQDKLASGQPIELALQRNGGTLQAIGLSWTEEERAAYKAQKAQRMAA